MTLSRFIEPLDRRSVLVHLGALLRLGAPVFLVPALVAAAAREWPEALSFGGVAALAFVAGGLRWRSRLRGRAKDLGLRDALLVTAAGYLAFALLGALPLLRHGAPVDAFFDSVSGFTTTGLGMLDPEKLPFSIQFFRAWSQWIGGAGIAVLSVAVLLPPGTTAARLHESEAERSGLVGSVVATARVVLAAYLALTVGAVVLLALAGTPSWEALLHGLAAISTGGFSPRSESLAAGDGAARLLALAFVMLAGAISMRSWARLRSEGPGALARDPQLRLLLIAAAVGALLFAADAGFAEGRRVPAFVDAVSTLSTTGFAVEDPARWSEGRKLGATALMLVGGSTGSTAGGLKLLRVLLLLKVVGWVVRRSLLPKEATVPLRLQGEPVSELVLRQAGAVAGLHLLVVAAGTVALAACGAGGLDALFESASATGTVGLSTGVTSPDLPVWGKLVLCLQMWAGRLEVLPLLVAGHPRTWFAQRRKP